MSRFFDEGGHKKGADEGQFKQSVYPLSPVFDEEGRFRHDSQLWLGESSHLVTEENARLIFEQWAPYWDLNCSYLMENSPLNILHTRFLQALFPKSKFICMLRHPVAVAYEIADNWTERGRMRVDEVIKYWLACNERFRRDRRRLKNSCVVRYESLVNRPQAILDQLCSFLGVRPMSTLQEMRTGINEKYFSRWKSRSDRYSNIPLPIKKMFRAYCYARFEKRVQRFGYSLENPGSSAGVLKKAA